MNQIVPLRPGAVPSVFASHANLPDMNAAAQQGLAVSFAAIGYKGKNWRIKYRGEDKLVTDDSSGSAVPIPILEVVVVGVSPAISKIWYEKRYTDGDNEAPDCFSIDGVQPDAASPKKQCATCAACPQNVWGSRITEAGKKAKACQDSRRIAVVPLGDIENETYGGPMLLRVPPMSLGNLAKYTSELARFGAQPYMVHTRLGFNYDVAYPEITFTAAGWLDDETGQKILDAMQHPSIDRMLSQEMTEATADPKPESALAGGGPAGAFAGHPAPTPAVAAPAPVQIAPAPQPVPAPAPTPAPAPAAAAPKPSPFSKPPAARPQATPAAAPAPAPTTTSQVPTVIQQVPEDMNAALDKLLA